jgi:hypothetical protein
LAEGANAAAEEARRAQTVAENFMVIDVGWNRGQVKRVCAYDDAYGVVQSNDDDIKLKRHPVRRSGEIQSSKTGHKDRPKLYVIKQASHMCILLSFFSLSHHAVSHTGHHTHHSSILYKSLDTPRGAGMNAEYGTDDEDGTSSSSQTPFRVIGIAFVVDQKGRGPRMVLRYPPAPSHPDDKDDIFFRLDVRQISKLFRPKPTLCGHPMTLSVGSTLFCCRAILIDDQQDDKETDEYQHVELFSVVVALAPNERGSTLPVTGWFEQLTQAEKREEEAQKGGGSGKVQGKTSTTFKTVRRIHVSLARLCRVLEREEKRCNYVSIQSSRYLKLRKQLRAEAAATISSVPSPTSAASVKQQSMHIRRVSTFSGIFERDQGSQNSSTLIQNQNSQPQAFETKPVDGSNVEQEILEVFMADDMDGNSQQVGGSPRLYRGNLAREMVLLYNALARNDSIFQPSPSMILTGNDGIVHVNGHIAVAIEAVTPRIIQEQEVRPYETLLFPHASPKELLKSLAGYGSSSSRRLQQVLLTVNPQKSLIDIAADANLSLQSSMEIAKYLVGKSAAVVEPVISRNCRFACDDIHRLRQIKLAFTHEFGAGIDLFSLVSFLTRSGWTLEEATTHLLTADDAFTTRLRVQVSAVATVIHLKEAREGNEKSAVTPPAAAAAAADPFLPGLVRDDNTALMLDLEDTLFQLTVWLVSHRVLVHLLEYMVSDTLSQSETTEEKSSTDKDTSIDDTLFRQMQDLDCLRGKVSLAACSWRIGIDLPRLKAFAERHPGIRVVRRPFELGDDWGRLFD